MNATILEALAYSAPLLIALGWLWACNVRLTRTIEALRANAILRNERGHFVTYANASREVRAKAEQN